MNRRTHATLALSVATLSSFTAICCFVGCSPLPPIGTNEEEPNDSGISRDAGPHSAVGSGDGTDAGVDAGMRGATGMPDAMGMRGAVGTPDAAATTGARPDAIATPDAVAAPDATEPPDAGAGPTGYPNASNTGVPAGTVLGTYTGPSDITVAGTVIDSVNITACLIIDAPGVVIKNSKIDVPNCNWTIYNNHEDLSNEGVVYHAGYTGTGLTIQDSEVGLRVDEQLGHRRHHVTVLRTNIHGCENGFDLDRDGDIEDSYIHDLYQSAAAHTDGIQSADGSNITLKHNTFEGDSYPCPSDCSGTSAINVGGGSGSITNTLIEDNVLAGEAYSLYCPSQSTTNYQVLNNHFSYRFRDPRSTAMYSGSGVPAVPPPWAPAAGHEGVGAYGTSDNCAGVISSGNVIDETGAPVTLE